MPGKPRENGHPFFLQIPAYAKLIGRALDRDADRLQKEAEQGGIPLTVEAEVDFLRAAADEARTYTTEAG
jgi:hypothetical protein